MSSLRQQLLILYLATPDLKSQTIGWSLYDATFPQEEQMNSGDSENPPYKSAFSAMQDGWNVIQIPSLPQYIPGHEHETGHLPYEYVLERKVAVHD
jgi:hypothetical protein